MSVAHDYETPPQRIPGLNPIDVVIGKNVKSRRMICGLSQTTLANHLGITFQQVQKYEKGANRVGGSRMWQIACVLDCSPNLFFEGLTSMEEPIDPARDRLIEYRESAQGLSLCLMMSQIEDPTVRKRIVSLAQSIADSPSEG